VLPDSQHPRFESDGASGAQVETITQTKLYTRLTEREEKFQCDCRERSRFLHPGMPKVALIPPDRRVTKNENIRHNLLQRAKIGGITDQGQRSLRADTAPRYRGHRAHVRVPPGITSAAAAAIFSIANTPKAASNPRHGARESAIKLERSENPAGATD